MKRKFIVIILCIAILSACAGIFVGCNSQEVITVSGSSSVTPLMEVLAAEYEKSHDVRIVVNMSSSGEGISDTQNGLNDFGMSSRALKAGEEGLEGVTLCMDGIALVVGKDCAVTDVKKTDVKALFENGTPIPGTSITAGIGRDTSSGTRGAFDELMGIEGSYHQNIATLAETGNVIEAIQGTVNSLGYISYGSLSNAVKAVTLDGIACTYYNIINNVYSLQRPFVIVLKEGKTLSDAAKGFYDYIMSDEAQEVIAREGYISIK